MKIAIDITPVSRDKAGVGYMTYSLVEALTELDKNNEYELLTNDKDFTFAAILPRNFKITIIESNKPGTAWMLKSRNYLIKNKFSLLISTSYLLWSIIYSKTLQFVNDIAPVKYPQFFTKRGSIYYTIQLRLALNRAHKVVTISQAVLSELLQINDKSNKEYIYLGVHKWTNLSKDKVYYQEIIKKYNLPSKYLIYVSTLEPRKNHINTLKGFSILTKKYPEYKLVIVGKRGWFYDEIFKVVKDLNLQDLVILTGYAPEEDLPGLMDLSNGSIMMSFYEGFGLPIIESLSRGKCSLVSDIPVFKEITAGSSNVIFADPNNQISISEGLVKLINQEFLTKDISFKTYTWANSAQKLLKIIQE